MQEDIKNWDIAGKQIMVKHLRTGRQHYLVGSGFILTEKAKAELTKIIINYAEANKKPVYEGFMTMGHRSFKTFSFPKRQIDELENILKDFFSRRDIYEIENI